MNCPDCRVRMDTKDYRDLIIDVCPKCDSVWFDQGELSLFKRLRYRRRLSRLDESAEFKQRAGSARVCPKCETVTLEMGAIKDYEAGHCSRCQGIWVDSRTAGRSKLETVVDTTHNLSYLPDILDILF